MLLECIDNFPSPKKHGIGKTVHCLGPKLWVTRNMVVAVPGKVDYMAVHFYL